MPQVDLVTYYPIVIWLCAYFFIFFNFLLSKTSLNFFNKMKLVLKNNIKYYFYLKKKVYNNTVYNN
jgi:hypothetical protein